MSCVAAQDTNSTDLTVQDSSAEEISSVSEIPEMGISEASDDLKNDINVSTPSNANSDDKLAATDNGDQLSGIIPHGHAFIDIYDAIELAGPRGVVDLEKTTYIGLNPIEVYHSVTINGNGAILDAHNIPLIFEIHESNVTIKNITFINCRALIDGGSIYWRGNNGMLVDCTFKNNYAAINGGAVYWKGNDGSIVNCNFINNSAGSDGGAVYLNADNCKIENSNFTNNTAVEGGAIYCNELLNPKKNNTILNCIFTDNTAKDNGGAVNLGAKNCNIDNSNFTGNTALGNGGAVYIEYELLFPKENNTISNCIFDDNTAQYYGGAVYIGAKNCSIDNCFFSDNSAGNNGGAVYLLTSNCNIDNSNFTGNTAKNGGAVYIDEPIITRENNTLSNCIFTSNSAEDRGGAIYIMGDHMTVDSAYFNNNVAVYGSAIYLNNDAEFINISNTEFGRNMANGTYIVLDINGNETYALANVTVDVYLLGNDNIANAIWNNGDATSVQLYNITCEFSKDGKGRSLKQFNTEGFANPTNGFKDESIIWQGIAENAQLIDILITDGHGNAVLNITNSDSPSSTDNSNLEVTNTNGTISVSLQNLKAGNYTVFAKHKGDQYYTAIEDSDTFVIYEKTATHISVENVTTYPGMNVTIQINVTTDENKAFSGNVTIEFPDGSIQPVEIIEGNGNAKWSVLEDHIPGTYNDTVRYLGNDTHASATGKGTITVKSIPTTVVVGNKTVKAGQNVTIAVNVTADNDKLINGDVIVTLPDGSEEIVEIIEGSGEIVWPVPEDYKGNYSVSADYSGNVTYLASNATGIVTVIPKISIDISVSNETTYPDSDVTVTINVTADDGNPFNGEVKVIMPNGSLQTVEIADGVASTALQLSHFDLLAASNSAIGTGAADWHVPAGYAPGSYRVSVEFDGNDDYLAANGTGFIEVIPIPTEIKASNITGKPGENVDIQINVISDNGKAFNGAVSVTLPDGSNHTVDITDGSGNVNWDIPEDYNGKYEYTVNYPGNETFLASNATGFITVTSEETPDDNNNETPDDNDDETPDNNGDETPDDNDDETPDNNGDETPVDEDSVTAHRDVENQNESLAKYETGNPILALLAVLALLSVNIKRKK